MRTYQTSMLEDKIVKLSQDIIKIKTRQPYLCGNASFFETQKLRIQSRLDFSVPGPDSTYYYWDIFVRLRFVGEHTNSTAIPKIMYQLYDSSGRKIMPDITGSFQTDEVFWADFYSAAVSEPNEHDFCVYLYLVTTQNLQSSFYGDFWCESNDTGVLKHIATYSGE